MYRTKKLPARLNYKVTRIETPYEDATRRDSVHHERFERCLLAQRRKKEARMVVRKKDTRVRFEERESRDVRYSDVATACVQ